MAQPPNSGQRPHEGPGSSDAQARQWRAEGLHADRGDATCLLPDGRQIAYRTFGAGDGYPLLALHGTPGSRLKFQVADAAARRAGVRVIAPDRWGYGGTHRHAQPTLRSYAGDVVWLADSLGYERFAVLGVSGGGPFAVAVASAFPRRVTALALAAPVGPIAGEDDTEISAFHRFCFGALARSPGSVGVVFGFFRSVLGVSAGLGMRMAMARVSSADREVFRQPEVARRLGETFTEGLRPGVVGPITDMSLFGAPWDIDISRVEAPTRLWLGTVDRNVPLSAARRLAARLSACDLVEIEGAGHLWIANNYATVIDWVASAAKP